MAMREMWKKTMVSLGLSDGEDEFEEDLATRRPEPSPVRTIGGAERPRDDRHPSGRGAVRNIPTSLPRQVHIAEPRIFEDAQDLADRFKSGVPVFINMKLTEPKHQSKILQFASGLVYGLNGKIQRVGENVFLLSPFNMEVSADERRRLAEHGLFGLSDL